VTDRPVVLVDARNALRSRWPNVPEDQFLELTHAWGEQEGVRLVVVFDGRAPGEGVGVHELEDGTTVVGTGGESADDWIAARAQTAERDERLWLVSSDRGLRARVEDRVERVLGGGSFLGLIGAADAPLGRG
jgi:hypothetical protein